MLKGSVQKRLPASPPVKSARGPDNSTAPVYLLTGLIFALILVVSGLIVWSVLNPDQAPRTSAERDIARFEEIVKKRPTDPQAHKGLGAAYYQTGAYDQAIKSFGKALKLKSNDTVALTALASAYIGKGDTKTALTTLKRAQKVDSRYEEAWFEEGKIYFNMGQYEKAIKAFDRSIVLKPMAADTHYLIGTAYEKTSNVGAAVIHYQRAVEYLPDYEEALEGLKRLKAGAPES